MSEVKKIYLEDGAAFTIVGGAAVTLFKTADISRVNINWGATIDLAGGKVDPKSSIGALVGEFTDEDEAVHQVYVEDGKEPGEVMFYYYAPATHKTYLKEGSAFEMSWKKNQFARIPRPLKMDIDEELTLSDENLAHTELGNDGPVTGTFVKDGATYNVYIDHIDDFAHFYCYFG